MLQIYIQLLLENFSQKWEFFLINMPIDDLVFFVQGDVIFFLQSIII